MKFTVLWLPTADAKLVELWMSGNDRGDIQRSADEIERLLASSPHDVGESRVAATRVLIVSPLGVYYNVNDADRRVTVFSVWRSRKIE